MPTLFVDNQVLIYAFEKCDPTWHSLIDSYLSSGHRLVLSEEILYEFGQSSSLEAALSLTDSVLEHDPLWIRSFAEIEADEICSLAKELLYGTPRTPISIFFSEFADVSQLSENGKLTPKEFVRFATDPRSLEGLGRLARQHAKVLNALSAAVAEGQLTKEVKDKAIRNGLSANLLRGSRIMPALAKGDVEVAVRLCFKHYKRLMKECPAYATETHLANYRSATIKRKTRDSDSRDLTMATAAFPYVTTFVTNDGYLHSALEYVKKHAPYISTKLVRGRAQDAV